MFDPSDKEANIRDIRTPSINPSAWNSQTWAAHMLFEINYKAVARQVDLEVWAYHLTELSSQLRKPVYLSSFGNMGTMIYAEVVFIG